MEAGYGDEPEDAAATARGVVDVGAVGLNLEDTADGGDEPLLPIERFVAKIAAVRAVGGGDRRPARPQRAHRRLHRPGRRPGDAARARRRARPGLPRRRRRLHLRPRRRRSGRDRGARAGHRRAGQRPRRPRLAVARPSSRRSASRGSASARGLPRRARARRRMAEEAYGDGTLDTMIAAQVSFADAQTLFASGDVASTGGRQAVETGVSSVRETDPGGEAMSYVAARPYEDLVDLRDRARDEVGKVVVGQGRRRRPAARRGARAGARPHRRAARKREDAARARDGARPRRAVQAHPVHAGHDAGRDHRLQRR